MNVENFWQQLKHDYLHRIVRPRLDHFVWVLIHKVTPAYIARAEILNDSHRLGQPKQLTTYQKYLKASWRKLLEGQVSGKIYETNIEDWTCSCGCQSMTDIIYANTLLRRLPLCPSDFGVRLFGIRPYQSIDTQSSEEWITQNL